jgi:hypothetical protein
MAHAYYLVAGWDHRPGTSDDDRGAGDVAVRSAFEDFPHAQFLDRLYLIGIDSAAEREQLRGALRYLASKVHPGLRYALSPPIAVGATWTGWIPTTRGAAVQRIAEGLDQEEAEE